MSSPLRILCVGAAATTMARLACEAEGEPWEVHPTDVPSVLGNAGGAVIKGGAEAVLFGLDGDLAQVTPAIRVLRGVEPGAPVIAIVPRTRRAVGPGLARDWADDFVVAGEADGACVRRVLSYAREGRRFEAWLIQSRELFHRVWASLKELVAVVGPDGRRLYNSPAYRSLLGDPAALLGTDSFREIHPDDRERVRELFRQSFATGLGASATFRFVRPDGGVRYVESQGVVIPGPEGPPERLVVVGRDVTRQRKAEAELREREDFFRRISESMTDLVAVLDRDGRRLYNSHSYRALFGGQEPEPASDSFAEIHPDDRERIRQLFDETVRTGEGRRAEFRFVLPNGRVRYLESVGSVMRDTAGRTAKVLVVSRDTSERREAEEALARERTLLRTLIDRLPDFIYVKDFEGRFVVNNVAHACLVGRETPASLVGVADRDVFPADLVEQYSVDDRAVMGRGEPVLNREEPVRDHAGRQFWVLTTKVPLRDSSSRIVGLVGISRDITERRRAEHELRQSKERLELVIRGSRDGIWDWDVTTNEVYFSPRWKGMLGYAEVEVPSTFDGWKSLIHPDDLGLAMSAIQAYFEGSAPEYELEHRLRHKDGSYRWILARGVALRDAGGRPLRMAGSHVDLTERKRTEERLRQAARWESVTTLAAGVAHQVKNPLQTILLGVDFLADRLGAPDPQMAELLASMRNAARHADTIICSLRDYALQRQPLCRLGDINALVEACLQFLNFEFQHAGIRVVRCLTGGLPPVRLDPEQIKQVCWILLHNAIDALAGRPDTAQLTVSTRFVRHWPAHGAIPPAPPLPVTSRPTAAGWVTVDVQDNGPGIPREHLDRVFDLFFTTKQATKGSGIGLALAQRIVESHGGTIEASSPPEGGAKLVFGLPVPVQPPDCATGVTPLGTDTP